ncbi:hypothetical protein TNCV_1723431 [Trichonephila clavipes]|nr:hypothetical protein TNCV_1723431 [Trichonephila clavipes]
MCGCFGRQVAGRNYPPTNKNTLIRALTEEWDKLPQQLLDNVVQNDEAHFWLNGYVKKQNGRIWSEANPQVYVETPLHPEKLTVCCALWAGGILLQKRDEGHNVTVNGDRCRAMITC